MYESQDKLVSHPDHYQSKKGIEVIDVIEAFTEGLEGIEATDTGNIIKYICRWKKKNGIQDLEKILWYTQHLIDYLTGKDLATNFANGFSNSINANSYLAKEKEKDDEEVESSDSTSYICRLCGEKMTYDPEQYTTHVTMMSHLWNKHAGEYDLGSLTSENVGMYFKKEKEN